MNRAGGFISEESTLSERTSHVRSPLPTRVRSACERCRHHKYRCDPFRPCSQCSRANVPCRPHRVTSWRRIKTKRNPRGVQQESELSLEAPAQQSRDGDHDGALPTRALRDDSESNVSTGRDIPSPSLSYGEAESAMGIARRICELGSHRIDEQATFAIPGYQAAGMRAPRSNPAATGQRMPISSILGQRFPSMNLVHGLLEDYFDSVHWFSLAIYEPKFRRRLHSIADGSAYPSQRPFLLLLAVILGMAAWYRSQRSGADVAHHSEDWKKWSTDLLNLVQSNLVELMDEPSVTATQTCILLGSHHVYHGRPNLSFSLLGTTIKMAQSLGLQRQLPHGEFDDIEESKRVWWTIYTWDRFASITYGRPLGINDKDCNLQMPADVLENSRFLTPPLENHTICFSTYQRELNQLYLIASPALEAIFGSRTFGTSDQLAGDSYYALVKHTTKDLQKWRHCLPPHLTLDLKKDIPANNEPSRRAYALQALSLQLTYDNLLIVLHRPLLARQVDHLSTVNNRPRGETGANSPAYYSPADLSSSHSNVYSDGARSTARTTSPEIWMDAAARTSRITELPDLARLAAESHLVAFLAINLFNAAVVLAVVALSEPLSDAAQEIKRTITRILRLQQWIGERSALSKQSTVVLKNVVAMLLRRESEVMLIPISGASQPLGHQTRVDSSSMSVEDALRLPFDVTLDSSTSLTEMERGTDTGRAHRLNESLVSVQCGEAAYLRGEIPHAGVC
ncbi:hypothetical protein P170DRAFT_492059 [Aspergillus steynii IBT 23096]|uniref:Zn(2)-C6 fungal-type domain-containing protein n=1 Tax=Aspergillus steynii IBT 23096 TaxID=1392250 RepID=A0A2I2GBQ0_9EURO|nr:uncharacterized protein P170DRAFT_492059 [Aspergillus steynii IBT 23096]PLB50308.1 hypothetical protein P170DRAFT_492059 [Aspergillus steynii IBT 23096]